MTEDQDAVSDLLSRRGSTPTDGHDTTVAVAAAIDKGIVHDLELPFRMVDAKPPRKASATMVARALRIMEALDTSRRGLNISEISRKLGIPKSSTHVIVLTLEELDYVHKAPSTRRYSLGLKAYGLGQAMMKSFSMAEAALPVMRKLVDSTDLTSHLAVLDKDQAVCVQKAEPQGLLQFDTKVGRRIHLHCTGVGKVILAHGGDELVRDYFSRKAFMRHTNKTITSPRALKLDVLKARRQGYAIDDQEEELEVRCVAVPVFNRGHEFAGALSVTGTTGQIPLSRIRALVKTLKESASKIYGIPG